MPHTAVDVAPKLVMLLIVAILAFAFVMRRTIYGLRIYTIGANRLAAVSVDLRAAKRLK